jgi:hypothetical protein
LSFADATAFAGTTAPMVSDTVRSRFTVVVYVFPDRVAATSTEPDPSRMLRPDARS